MFVFQELEKRCKEDTLQEQIKRQVWVFCRTTIYTPQAYVYYKPRKYLRKSKQFDKRKKDKYVRRNKPNRKCHCFICGDPNHFANKCPNRHNNKQRSNLVDELDEYKIESSDENDLDDNESIYNIISDNEESSQKSITYTLVNNENELCNHPWIQNKGNDHIPCFLCNRYPEIIKRFQCDNCFMEICFLCAKRHFNLELITKKHMITEKNFQETIDKHEAQIQLLHLDIDILKQEIRNIKHKQKDYSQFEPGNGWAKEN